MAITFPPIPLLSPLAMSTPTNPLGTAPVFEALVPMSFPLMVFWSELPEMKTPKASLPEMTLPWPAPFPPMVLPLAPF